MATATVTATLVRGLLTLRHPRISLDSTVGILTHPTHYSLRSVACTRHTKRNDDGNSRALAAVSGSLHEAPPHGFTRAKPQALWPCLSGHIRTPVCRSTRPLLVAEGSRTSLLRPITPRVPQ